MGFTICTRIQTCYSHHSTLAPRAVCFRSSHAWAPARAEESVSHPACLCPHRHCTPDHLLRSQREHLLENGNRPSGTSGGRYMASGSDPSGSHALSATPVHHHLQL